jgi:hypothetical protein
LTEGELRALVDGAASAELSEQWSAHAQSCPRCASQLDEIRSRAGAVDAMLGRLGPTRQPNADLALQRWRAWHASGSGASTTMKGDSLMSRLSGPRRRGALAGVALVAIMIFAIAAAPVGTMASNVLNRFRVQQFQAITLPVSTDMIGQFAQNAKAAEANADATPSAQADQDKSMLSSMLSQLGTFSTTFDQNSVKEVASLADANSHLNGQFAMPSNLSTFAGVQPKVYVGNAGTAQYTLNLANAQRLLQMVGAGAAVTDTSTPTATITLDVPASAAAFYEANGKHLVVGQMASPTLDIPASIDTEMLRNTLLSIPGLPADVVAQIRNVHDWKNTLIIPVPSDATTSQETVNGAPALLIKSQQGSAVLWQKDGVLHIVATDGTADVLAVANSAH